MLFGKIIKENRKVVCLHFASNLIDTEPGLVQHHQIVSLSCYVDIRKG